MSGRAWQLAPVLALLVVAAVVRAVLNGGGRARRRSRSVLGRPNTAEALLRRGHQWLRRLPGRRRPRWLVGELLLLPVLVPVGFALHSPLPPLAALLLAHPSSRWRSGRRAARQERARSAAVIELCAALAGELRSGATPQQALDVVTGPGRPVADLARRLGPEAMARLSAGRYGADVPAALRWLAGLPGGGGASAVAACWQVTTDSGTGLAGALDQVAEALRADRALQEEIRSELTGPRTTAAMLAALPLGGLALGSLLGAAPERILLRTPLGIGCLVAGALLEAAGLMWTDRIVRQALADLGISAGTAARSDRRRTGPEAASPDAPDSPDDRRRPPRPHRRGPCRSGVNARPARPSSGRAGWATGRGRGRAGARLRRCTGRPDRVRGHRFDTAPAQVWP
ncbi:type II secretion system F family protein [Kitasatospora sp. NPDC058965]|uniref:type II secretion system F family protein n=1 Tax=Kitasatospora sp. NPDC058965 TaxID=3346682 RepID=UPI003699CDFA